MEVVTVNWPESIESFATTYDMDTDIALDWLATRDSLETVCGLLGVSMDGNTKSANVARVLRSLGAHMESHGYPPLPLWCVVSDYVPVEWSRPSYLPEPLMDDYLQLRSEGVVRSRCAKQLNTHPKMLHQMLNQWGIADKRDEAEVLATWKR